MATLKMLSYHVVLAPIGRAFVNSMIYGWALFLSTLPKALLQQAASNDSSSNRINHLWLIRQKTQQLAKLAELVVDILRTQFIAILGNISVAMPVALLIALAWGYFMIRR